MSEIICRKILQQKAQSQQSLRQKQQVQKRVVDVANLPLKKANPTRLVVTRATLSVGVQTNHQYKTPTTCNNASKTCKIKKRLLQNSLYFFGKFTSKDMPVERSSQCRQICPHCQRQVNAMPFGCLGGLGGLGVGLHLLRIFSYICWFKNLSQWQFFIFYCMSKHKNLSKHLKS